MDGCLPKTTSHGNATNAGEAGACECRVSQHSRSRRRYHRALAAPLRRQVHVVARRHVTL
eukprot:4558935-Pyramimonas_sp.AAC.1